MAGTELMHGGAEMTTVTTGGTTTWIGAEPVAVASGGLVIGAPELEVVLAELVKLSTFVARVRMLPIDTRPEIVKMASEEIWLGGVAIAPKDLSLVVITSVKSDVE